MSLCRVVPPIRKNRRLKRRGERKGGLQNFESPSFSDVIMVPVVVVVAVQQRYNERNVETCFAISRNHLDILRIMVKLTIGTCLAGGWLRAGGGGEGRGSRAIVSLENKFSFPRKRYASVVLSFFTLILDAIHKGGLRSIERAVQSCAIYRGNDSTVFQGYRTRSRCDQGRSFRIDRGKSLLPPVTRLVLFFRIFSSSFFLSSPSNR